MGAPLILSNVFNGFVSCEFYPSVILSQHGARLRNFTFVFFPCLSQNQVKGQCSSAVEQRFRNSERGFSFNCTSMDSREFETTGKGRNRNRNFQRVASSASKKPQKHPYRIQKRDTMWNGAEQWWLTVSGAAKFQNPGCNEMQRPEMWSASVLSNSLKWTQWDWRQKRFGMGKLFWNFYSGAVSE